MKGKKLAKILTVAIATALVSAFAAGLTACSGDGEAKTITGSYSTHSYQSFTLGVEWDMVTSYQLDLFSDDTYVLTYKMDFFGTDYEGRGYEEVVTSGSYTSAESSDGSVAHLDITLEQADTVIYNISGKLATFVSSAIGKTGGNAFVLNSGKWNATMTSNYALMLGEGTSFDSDDAAKQDFLSKYGMGYSVTIEEPALEEENTSLNAQIVTIESNESTPLMLMGVVIDQYM